MVATRPASLSRKLLGEFLKNPETIKAFENLDLNSADLADVVSAIEAVSVLTLGLSDQFENSRVVSSDGEVQLTDGGAGGTLTFGLSDTGVDDGAYGGPAKTLQVAVNAKGRLSLVQAHDLVSDNVAEGAANLYFTDARARNALSDGAGITYTPGTGEIAATPAGTYGAPTGTLSRATFATYAAPTVSAVYVQAEVQALANAVQAVSRTLAALITDLKANGNLT